MLDKWKSESVDSWNRIEVTQNSVKKLPTRKIEVLQNSMLLPRYNPLKAVSLHDFAIPVFPLHTKKELSKFIKHIRFETLVKANGLHYARRYFSLNDNFRRDYGHLFKEKESISLGDYYHEGMKLFFKRGC